MPLGLVHGLSEMGLDFDSQAGVWARSKSTLGRPNLFLVQTCLLVLKSI